MDGRLDRATVVGAGRIGGAFRDALTSAGVEVDVVGRGEHVALEGRPRPVLVTTRMGDLPDVLPLVPAAGWPHLVLVQNGDVRLVAEASARPAPLNGHLRMSRLLLTLGARFTGAVIAPKTSATGNTLPPLPNIERWSKPASPWPDNC